MNSPRPTAETDGSSRNEEQSSGDESSDWIDEEEEEDRQSDVRSTSGTSEYYASSPRALVPYQSGEKGRRSYGRGAYGREDYGQPRGNGLYGNPLIPFGRVYPYPQAGQSPDHYSTPSFGANQGSIPSGYPSDHIHYPRVPNMSQNQFPHLPADRMNYYPHQAPVQPGTENPVPAAETALARVPSPVPVREDPEKIRLEAEIAAFKFLEEKAQAAEKQKVAESQIRMEAEEAFHRRIEDMRLAQEEAKKELERARFEAEKAAQERLQAERKAGEDRSRRFKDFATNLEKEVRLKVEMEKMAEIAERDAKAKQNEDLERLAKSKLIQSMDEIVSLTKKRVLHDLVVDGDSMGSKERQSWLTETQNEGDAKGSVLRAEAGQLSIRRPSMQPTYASASTTSASSSSPQHAGPRQPFTYDESDFSRIEDLVGRIADAVVARLIHSPSNSILIHRPPAIAQYHRRYTQSMADLYTGTQNSIQEDMKYGSQGKSDDPLSSLLARLPQKFYKPPKPARLRGRSLRGPTGIPPSKTASNDPVCAQDESLGERPGASLLPPPPSPLSPEMALNGKRDSDISFSEVMDATQKAPIAHGGDLGLAKGGGEKWRYPHVWIEELDPSLEDISGTGNNKNVSVDKQNGGDDLQRIYTNIFHGTEEPLTRLLMDARQQTKEKG